MGWVGVAFLISLGVEGAFAQSSGAPARMPAFRPGSDARAARAFEAAAHAGPPALDAFLRQFPKGADLHVHLSGAVYAETFIRDAGEDGLCVDPAALRFVHPPCTGALVSATRLSGVLTGADQDLYDRLVNSFSMRSFVPTPGFSAHDPS